MDNKKIAVVTGAIKRNRKRNSCETGRRSLCNCKLQWLRGKELATGGKGDKGQRWKC